MELSPLYARIVRESGVPDLMEVLAQRMPATDLQALLLEVARLRASQETPARLIDRYARDPHVAPSPNSPRAMAEIDRLAFEIASPEFEPIELSPVNPLGAVSALTNVSQNKVLATMRGTEVVADATNLLALEVAARRRKDRATDIGLCASHRLLRMQGERGPTTYGHFRIFVVVNGGRDLGSYRFETASLLRHIRFHLRLLDALRQHGFKVGALKVVLTVWDASRESAIEQDVVRPLQADFPEVEIAPFPERAAGVNYYRGTAFQIHARDGKGEDHFLVDGGFVDWTQQLLNDKKERLMSSGIGTERLCAVFRSNS